MTNRIGIAGACIAAAAAACATEVEQAGEYELAWDQGRTFALVEDGDHLFWSGDAGVWRKSIRNGVTAAVYDREPTLAMTVGGDRVYWATATEVMTARRIGGEAEVVAADQDCVFAMAADERRAYWASIVDGQVWSWDATTRARTLIADGQGNVTGIAVGGDRVYWSTGAGTIGSAAATGGDVRILVDDATWKSSVAIAGDDVVWIDLDATLGAIDRHGGPIRRARAAAGVGSFVSALAADDAGLYWLRADGALGGRVLAAPALDEPPATIAEGDATAIAAGADAIYWANADGTIHARAR